MRISNAAAVIALLTGMVLIATSLTAPAYAQAPSINLLQDNTPAKSQEQKDAEEARDKAYKESLKKIPDAKAPSDPWGTVRSGDAAKTSASNTSTPKTSTPKTSTPKSSGAKAPNSKTAASAKPKTKTGTDAN